MFYNDKKPPRPFRAFVTLVYMNKLSVFDWSIVETGILSALCHTKKNAKIAKTSLDCVVYFLQKRSSTGRGPKLRMTKMTEATRPAAHIRHAGLIIDASFNKAGGVDYYVVEGCIGRYYSLAVAKEIADHRAKRKATTLTR